MVQPWKSSLGGRRKERKATSLDGWYSISEEKITCERVGLKPKAVIGNKGPNESHLVHGIRFPGEVASRNKMLMFACQLIQSHPVDGRNPFHTKQTQK